MRAYTDIFANQARNNIQESLFDLGPDSPYNPFVQVLPSVEDGLSPQSTCRPIPGFTFSLGDGIAGDKVDNLSVVTNPDGTATTKDQANELDSNGQPTGRKIAGAIVYKLTKDQMQRAFNGQSLWVQQGTTTDPLNTATFGNKYGFGALRCAVDNLNGDNVEYVRYPGDARNVFCYAFDVNPAAAPATIKAQVQLEGDTSTQTFHFGGNVSYNPGGTFDLTVNGSFPGGDTATFTRGATLGQPGKEPWQLFQDEAPGYDLISIECTALDGSVITPAASPLEGSPVTIDLAAGDTVTCVFVNRPEPPPTGGVRVRKTTLGSAGGPFTFAIGDLPELTATTTAPGQTVVAGDFDDVLGDSATLTETFPPGDGILWEATSAVCNGDPATAIEPPPSGDAAWTVPVDPGATVDCTITNTGRPQGAITVQKTTQGAVGTFDYIVTPVPGPLTRTLPLAQAATTTAEGVPVTAVGDPLTDLPYGRYLITEIGPPGTDEGRWLLQGATCGLGAPRDRPTVGVEITLTPQNPTATCSFRNQFELLPPVRPASRFVALTPNRILDTRTQNGQVGYSGDKPGPNQAFDLQVAGRGGVPAEDVTAVVMTVTSTEPDTEGYITVWPAGEPQPTISNLNTRPQPSVPLGQQAMPNLVTVPLGSTGRCRSSARPRPTSWPTWPASTRRCRCRPRAGTSRSARPSGCSTPAR